MLKRGLLLSFALLTASACTIEIGDGSQLGGQRCFQESDCAAGLTCYQRTCTPELGSGGPANNDPDMGNNASNANNVNNISPNNNINNVNNVSPNNGWENNEDCRPGETQCRGPSVLLTCLEGGEIAEERCPDDSVCENGQCVGIGPNCRDGDGDGYGPGCDRGFDCNDMDPRVNPGQRESCATGDDDDCNGTVNEGCNPDGCCAPGCAATEFCNAQCFCQPYDPTICQFQNQPCAVEGSFDNGFYCLAFSPANEPRCWGICDITAPDPDATCPEPGSVCAFDAGDGMQGICMSPCGPDASGQIAGCGEPGMGCIEIDVGFGDGICVPNNPANGRDDLCDPDYLFDCDDSLLCIQTFGNRGRCREACRPFFWNGMGTDCDVGHCLAFSADIGVCFSDNNSVEGEMCGPQQSACNEDAVGCYDAGGGQECIRLCRLAEGNSDCFGVASQCQQFDGEQTEIGVCF